ncbi:MULTISPECIES: hypothetical protein [Enterobacter cloacae complex]|uniref:hypothetical protein n=1 Tax=Enterobacter cloacae complex TaxID=354276 RepID=UPI00064B1409|nr:hypothetical protein [Enterobacter hormaechei]KLQ50839.1 hypothetical protein ABF70_09795 [Enterobacter hormaechei subsp. steigerwaltii]KTI11663.1 hypothetical protein ASV11_23065 [Enterobacter hormaechei subsp. xiangfangensis]KTJ62398.1 hypothetical protein ASU80_22245 [Enterobacter hormaechei subsp. xiangfangensis]MBJ6510673.1 hypothetical protein [Enterobacter hormaechei]MBJ6605335.1 hypothetical protein [Enterobacter hormaechei]
MLRINNVDVRKHLEIFEQKRTPDNGRISLMYENAIHYDMYSVYIKDDDGNEYLFDRYIDGVIKAKRWDTQRNVFNVDVELNPEQFNANSFSGIFYYHAHEFKFNSLDELGCYKVWKLKRFANSENKKLSREKFLYRQRKQEITDAMTVLTSVVRIYREQQGERPFSEILIMNDVAGRLWIYHDDPSRLKKELRLCLDSLVENGDLLKSQEGYKPSGKSVNTLANFNKTEQRYKENIRSQRSMFWATLFAAIGGLGSMIAAFIGVMK